MLSAGRVLKIIFSQTKLDIAPKSGKSYLKKCVLSVSRTRTPPISYFQEGADHGQRQ
jgi:hypothetical protein